MDYRIDFGALPWESPMAGVRQKVVQYGNRRVRLVEFGRGFIEPGLCEKGHTGYALAGEMEVAFDDRNVTFRSGDGVIIPAGPAHRHKATVLSDVFRAVLVEDV
jgi:quercetin dioxygenase-like cupin family protein